MPRMGPIKRRDLISCLRQLGFTGPYPGSKHELMRRGDVDIRIPNPHHSDISLNLLQRILKEAGVTRAEWEALP